MGLDYELAVALVCTAAISSANTRGRNGEITEVVEEAWLPSFLFRYSRITMKGVATEQLKYQTTGSLM